MTEIDRDVDVGEDVGGHPEMVRTPTMTISIDITTKVYGRLSAMRTSHIIGGTRLSRRRKGGSSGWSSRDDYSPAGTAGGNEEFRAISPSGTD